jgi:hypothetical protein
MLHSAKFVYLILWISLLTLYFQSEVLTFTKRMKDTHTPVNGFSHFDTSLLRAHLGCCFKIKPGDR